MKTLSANSVDYREWNEKFKNAFSQIRSGLRRVLEELEKMAGKCMGGGLFGGKGDVAQMQEITASDINSMYSGGDRDWERLSDDIYSVLLDRTDGELHRKVVNAGARADAAGHRDAGAKAYITVYVWLRSPRD